MPISREQALRNADEVIDTIKENYDQQLLASATEFLELVKKGQLDLATAAVHNIASEAATFEWIAVSETAEKIRDVLEAEGLDRKQRLALLGAHSLVLLVNSKMKTHSEKTKVLLQEFENAFVSVAGAAAA